MAPQRNATSGTPGNRLRAVGRQRVRAFAELLRVPNVFSAVADIVMGFLFTHPRVPLFELSSDAAGAVSGLIAVSCSLYLAGMVLNDVFDRAVDARERPSRPIPSGRVSITTARRLGFALLGLGMGMAWGLSMVFAASTAGVIATILAACVLAYDGLAKNTLAGPLLMGGCRFMNVMLGMSLSGQAVQADSLLVAAGIGVYVAGISWLARTEANPSARSPLVLGTAMLVGGLAILSCIPLLRAVVVTPRRWAAFWSILALLVTWRCVPAIARPSAQTVQAAVRSAIQSLIILDAAVTFAAQGASWGVAVLCLLFPAFLLGQWIYST